MRFSLYPLHKLSLRLAFSTSVRVEANIKRVKETMSTWNMEEAKKEVLVQYKQLSQVRTLSGARISENERLIYSFWTQRNIETGKTQKFLKTYMFDSNLNITDLGFPVDVSNELMCASITVESEVKRAVLRDIPNGKSDQSRQVLEIWSNQNLVQSVDLTSLNLHGSVYSEEDFMSFVWAPDGSKILYVAEKKYEAPKPFFARADGIKKLDLSKEGTEYAYRQEWGEKLAGRVSSVICQYDLVSDEVEVVDQCFCDSLCPAQLSYTSNGTHVLGLLYETLPRKLGLTYCRNRPGLIFLLELSTKKIKYLNNKGTAVYSPIISLGEKYILWLEKSSGGPHNSGYSLMRVDYPVESNRRVEPDCILANPTSYNEVFSGLYNVKFVDRCWVDENTVIVSATQKFQVKTYCINIVNGSITEVKYGTNESKIVLDCSENYTVYCLKNFLHPDVLIMSKFDKLSSGTKEIVQWQVVSQRQTLPQLENIVCNLHDLEGTVDDLQVGPKIKNFTCIYLGPNKIAANNGEVPVILFPHGGPHANFVNQYSLEPALYVSLGYAVIFVNYRGSTGCGQDSVDYLLGRIGVSDVADCMQSLQFCIKKYPVLNTNQVFLMGGSHGGFLVHHLSGQYPDRFTAVVSRNPVVDVASMSTTSDIPDWCAVEAGGKYSQKGFVDNELFLKMRKASPLEHAHKIKAPTYLMLGSKDLRVPMAQGLELYHRLKANGIVVEANIYEDNHSLQTVKVELNQVINGALWLLKYTK